MRAREAETGSLHISLFMGAFLAGTASIIVMKLLHMPQLMVTSAPIAIMLVYAGVSLTFRRLRMRADQTGDNLYYLGFLFTLVSLSFTLWQFANNEDVTREIIENFGIALGSTIAGLFLRVLFAQLRYDPIETERQARVELAETARLLRNELQQVAVDFNEFRRQLQQQIADSHLGLREQLDHSLSAFTERLRTVIEGASTSIAGSYEGLSGKAEQIAKAGDDLIFALNGIGRRLEETELPPDTLNRQLEPTIASIRAAAEKLAGIVQGEADGRQKLIADVARLGDAATGLEATVAQLGRASALLSERTQARASTVLKPPPVPATMVAPRRSRWWRVLGWRGSD